MNQSNSSHHMNTEGLLFFGKVNASISHELKNILAIISETAGFLKDLSELAKQGKEFKIDLLEGCCESIDEDIQRGFTTIKKMNQFAHSVDVPVKEVDLVEMLRLVTHLVGYLSFTGDVYITNENDENHLIFTSPFLLQNVIYQSLIFIFNQTGSENEVHVKMILEKDGSHLVFSSNREFDTEAFSDTEIEKSAAVLGVKIELNTSLKQVDMKIPYISDPMVLLAKEMQVESIPKTRDVTP